MKKLTYKKITDSILEIDLQNGYAVYAIIKCNKKENIYTVSLYLTDFEITLYDLMNDYENIEFATVTDKTIYSAVLKEVATLMENNKFDRYFDRYEYMLQCFDRGNELFEQESLGDK